MSPVSVIVIFVLVWWCVFFAMLPLGVRGRWESEADGVEGADPGAPQDPNLKKKALWTTLAAMGITVVIVAVNLSGVINFRD